MAKSTWILSAALAMGLSGAIACDGSPSPETTILCSTVGDILFEGAAGSSAFFIVVKVITIDDSGSASGSQPGNDLESIVYGDSDLVSFCEGRCDGADTYDTNLTTRTDENGVLEYTIRLQAPNGTRTGQVTEIFGNSTCQSTYSASGA